MTRYLLVLVLLIFLIKGYGQDTLDIRKSGKVGIGQEYSNFDKQFSDWYTTTLDININQNNWVIIPRLYFSRRFDETGWLFGHIFWYRVRQRKNTNDHGKKCVG